MVFCVLIFIKFYNGFAQDGLAQDGLAHDGFAATIHPLNRQSSKIKVAITKNRMPLSLSVQIKGK